MLKQNESDEAISCFNQAIELKPDYAVAYNNKGMILNDLKKYKEAVSCFNKAIELDSNYFLAIKNRDISLNNLKKDNYL